MANQGSSDPINGASQRSNRSTSSTIDGSGERDNQSRPNINHSHQDENSNYMVNHSSSQANAFPSPRESYLEINHHHSALLGLPVYHYNPLKRTFDQSTGPLPRSNSSSSLTEGNSEIQNDNASIANRAGARVVDNPMPTQRVVIIDTSLFMNGQSSRSRSNIHGDGNPESSAGSEMRSRQEGQELVVEGEQNGDMGTRPTKEQIIMMCIGHETFESAAEEDQENKEACNICLAEYINKEEIGRLDCAHKFHIDCIKQWLVKKNVCPICRRMALMPIEKFDDDDFDDVDDDDDGGGGGDGDDDDDDDNDDDGDEVEEEEEDEEE